MLMEQVVVREQRLQAAGGMHQFRCMYDDVMSRIQVRSFRCMSVDVMFATQVRPKHCLLEKKCLCVIRCRSDKGKTDIKLQNCIICQDN